MDISIPELGEVEQVRLVRWLVDVGQAVQEGQELAELEADKAVFVVEAPAMGVLQEILASQGDAAQPGQLIARLEVK
ncbi:MAG: lipoyl domain-containing protein [Candidatus Bipolaricaulota bacterium]